MWKCRRYRTEKRQVLSYNCYAETVQNWNLRFTLETFFSNGKTSLRCFSNHLTESPLLTPIPSGVPTVSTGRQTRKTSFRSSTSESKSLSYRFSYTYKGSDWSADGTHCMQSLYFHTDGSWTSSVFLPCLGSILCLVTPKLVSFRNTRVLGYGHTLRIYRRSRLRFDRNWRTSITQTVVSEGWWV